MAALRRQADLHRLSAAHRCRRCRRRRASASCPTEPYILVTTGGGGDGEELIDWVLSAYERDPRHPAPGAARVRAVHAPRAAARFPGARGAARASVYTHHLRRPVRAAGRARDRRGRDGRLQHVLRDPVVRQAGADRAAHRAAPGAVPARRARQPSWAWCACCPTTACGRRGAWPSSCARWPAGRARRPEQIPGLLDGLERITERAAPGSTCTDAAGCHAPPDAPRRMDVAAARRRVAVVVKGYPRLSETFIAQEILALERRGLALTIVSLRHPTDPRRARVHRADPGAGALSAGVSAPGAARACCAAWRQRAALADLPRGAAPVAARPAPRSDHQPRPPLRPGAGARRRAAGRTSACCTRTICTRRPRSRAMPPCCAACRGAPRRTPRTSGPRRTGRSARSSRDCAWADHLHRGRRRASARAGAGCRGACSTYHGLDAQPLSGAAADARAPTAAIPTGRCACSASRASCRRRASRCCSRRWRRCRRSCTGATSMSAAGRCASALAGARPRGSASPSASHGAARCRRTEVLAAYRARRSVRAGEPDRAGRRSRRPAERAAGGGRHGAAGRREPGRRPCPS